MLRLILVIALIALAAAVLLSVSAFANGRQDRGTDAPAGTETAMPSAMRTVAYIALLLLLVGLTTGLLGGV